MAKNYSTMDKAGLGSNASPTTKYLLKSAGGGGKSSVVKGGEGKMFAGGPQQGDKTIGTKRFDVTNRSLNRRGM